MICQYGPRSLDSTQRRDFEISQGGLSVVVGDSGEIRVRIWTWRISEAVNEVYLLRPPVRESGLTANLMDLSGYRRGRFLRSQVPIDGG